MKLDTLDFSDNPIQSVEKNHNWFAYSYAKHSVPEETTTGCFPSHGDSEESSVSRNARLGRGMDPAGQ